MPTGSEVKGAFRFIKFGTKMAAKQDKVREAYNALEKSLRETLKDNAEATQAFVSLKASYLFASQAVRAEQIERNATASSRR